ncbi:MarR family winged helix-turn-helix transcriptional regulator [Nioella sp.]|uniref:MarR family winged helix-turn-helix transcriptional regulator n=1 Tax=Nioella sp. TaxID=1912091 RepID=UPI0035176C4D
MNAPFPTDTKTEEPVELGALTGSVGFMLRMCQTRAYDQFFQEFLSTDVTPGVITLLWVLDLNPGLKQGNVGRTLNIKPAHMTKLVQRLVKAGYVERRVPPEDRRSIRLHLTASGRDYLNRYRERFLAVHKAERVGLSDAEMATLLALLNKLNFEEAPECP